MAESLLLASLFFGLPLFTKKELRASLIKGRRLLGYFACLGIGFIFIEITLIQRLVLFLGAPVYSIAAVLSGLLVAAGLGSLFSGRIKPEIKNIRRLIALVAMVVLGLQWVWPQLSRLFLGTDFMVRLLISLLVTGLAGFFMGMPLPIGIRYLKENNQTMIPWAWAMNGYFTVIGSALSVILAANLGFSIVFYVAVLAYLSSLFFLGRPKVP